MKKLMAILLTVALLVSGSVFGVAADESPDRVVITACDTLTGWHGAGSEGIPDPELNEDLSDYSVVAFTYTGLLYANGGWSHPEAQGHKPTNGIKIHYLPMETETRVHDISGMNILAFDLYISHVEKVQDATFELEIGSAGKADLSEKKITTSLKGMMGGALKDGWNHFEIPLSYFSDSSKDDSRMDMKAWNYLRLFNIDQIDLGDSELVLAFRNIYFAKSSDVAGDNGGEGATSNWVPVFSCETALGALLPDSSEKTAGQSSISYTFTTDGRATPPNRQNLGYVVDGTGMDSLEFDVYLSDMGIVDMFSSDAYIGDSGIELSSAGKADHGELAWRLTDIFKGKSDWQTGWNHVTLALSSGRETQSPSNAPEAAVAFDVSAVNFFGIYWVTKAAAPASYTIKFDNIALTTAQASMGDEVAQTIAEIEALAAPITGIKQADINADNYATISEQYKALEAAFDALSNELKTAVDEVLNVKSGVIRSVGRALEQYEKTLEAEPEMPGTTDPEVPGTTDPEVPGTTEPEVPGTTDPETPGTDNEQTGGDEQTGDDEQTSGDEPVQTKDNTLVIIIIGGAVAVVVVAIVVVLIVKKSKK